MVDWQEEYEKKTVSPEEAIKAVKSGDCVSFAYGMEPLALGMALTARGGELSDVKVFVPAPGMDFPWYEPGWEESFQIEVGFVLPIVREMISEKRGDYLVSDLQWAHQPGISLA